MSLQSDLDKGSKNKSLLPPIRASSTSDRKPVSVLETKDRAVPGLSALAVLQNSVSGFDSYFKSLKSNQHSRINVNESWEKYSWTETLLTVQLDECTNRKLWGNRSWWRWKHFGSPRLWRLRTLCLYPFKNHWEVTVDYSINQLIIKKQTLVESSLLTHFAPLSVAFFLPLPSDVCAAPAGVDKLCSSVAMM